MPYCQRCGSEAAQGSRFCGSCGASLEQPSWSITTGNVSGTGVAIGPQASANVTQGVNVEDLARLLDRARVLVDQRGDGDPAALREAIDVIEGEAAKGEDADESRIRRYLRMLAEAAPDVLAVTSAALLDPITGVSEAVRRVAEAIRPELEE